MLSSLLQSPKHFSVLRSQPQLPIRGHMTSLLGDCKVGQEFLLLYNRNVSSFLIGLSANRCKSPMEYIHTFEKDIDFLRAFAKDPYKATTLSS